MKVKYTILSPTAEKWKACPLSSGLPNFTLVLLYHASFLSEFSRNFCTSTSYQWVLSALIRLTV